VNNLPRVVVTQARRGRASNSRLLDRKPQRCFTTPPRARQQRTGPWAESVAEPEDRARAGGEERRGSGMPLIPIPI